MCRRCQTAIFCIKHQPRAYLIGNKSQRTKYDLRRFLWRHDTTHDATTRRHVRLLSVRQLENWFRIRKYPEHLEDITIDFLISTIRVRFNQFVFSAT